MAEIHTPDSLIGFFVTELTAKLPPDRAGYMKGNSFWLRCPFHNNGQERTPSFTVNLNPKGKTPLGYCGCFGCKAKMPWNEFAKLFHLTEVSSGAVTEALASQVFRPPQRGQDFLPDMARMVPWPKAVPWRGIDGETVIEMGGRIMNHRDGFSLFLPVTVYDEIVGGITALTERPDGKNELAYFNSPGEWSSGALLGFDLAAQRSGPLFVVEGPRDTANVLQRGGRVVGLIGSAVTPAKLHLITELDAPIVIIATDPDEAGEGAARRLKDTIGKVMPTVRLRMREGTDPADLTKRQVAHIIRKAKERV